MFGIPGPIGTFLDLLVVVTGFGLIVFFHECGHFFAARWAGIRVLAFAIGFGPAAFSFRKGMGFRRGSSEAEYLERTRGRDSFSGAEAVSPTEYRFNWLPFGGYVKMLGQEDMNPGAVSTAPDSYQNCKPWKRMVVISAGVVMNLILAAVLFVVVFMAGLKVEPAIVGGVEPGSPAASAVPVNAEQMPGLAAGLQPGDQIARVNGRKPNSYADYILSVAMTSRGEPVDLLIERPGVAQPLHYQIKPEESRDDGLLTLGTMPSFSLRFSDLIEGFPASELERVGIAGVEPGATIVAADGHAVHGYSDLEQAFAASGGRAVPVTIEAENGTLERSLEPRPEFQISFIAGSQDDSFVTTEHLLGLSPVLRVSDGAGAVNEQGKANGLEPGDIFAQLGGVEFPTVASGIRTIRASAGRTIDVVVLREVDGQLKRVSLEAKVSKKGLVGFTPGDTRDVSAMVGMPPPLVQDDPRHKSTRPAADGLITAPGQRIVAVNGVPVANLIEVRTALQQATAGAAERGEGAEVPVSIEWPLVEGASEPELRTWSLSSDDVRELHGLSWSAPLSSYVFEPEQVLLKSSSPGEALATGLSETRRVLVTTYITFARLFQQTVKIENLKGPVGIAHAGTLLADRGFVWLLFFMAVISVNLAVINFLPLPIVDGGQFLMIVYEQIRGRPVPIPVQNAVTMAGFVLIASLFLIVTFNDVKNLLGL